MPLTDTACRNAKGRDKPYKLSDAEGLFLLVNPKGSRLWRLKYRFGGKEKLLSFGPYPTIGLAEARLQRAAAKKALQSGLDPSKLTPGATAEIDPKMTFEHIAREWLGMMSTDAWKPAHAARVWSRFIDDVFPEIGHRQIAELEALDILALLRKIEARSALEMAKRVRQSIGQVFRYAIANGWAKRDPTPDLKGALKPSPRVRHQAKLAAADVADFLAKLAAYEGDRKTALAIELVMHTWVRTGEIRFARLSEFDGHLWRIPGARMKMHLDHIVPLSDRAKEIVAELTALRDPTDKSNDPFLVSGMGGKPISENTLIYAIYRMGYHSRATVHGLRGTASTVCNESGLFNADWIERQLAHVPGDAVRSAYNAAQHLADRKKMMAWYSAWIEAQKSVPEIAPGLPG